MCKLKNNGKGFTVYGGNLRQMRLTGGELDDMYQLEQFHFHWGLEKNGHRRGSEHAVNGRQSAAELHLVHFKTKFKDIGAAVKSGEKDALSVIGIFLETERSMKTLPANALRVRETRGEERMMFCNYTTHNGKE